MATTITQERPDTPGAVALIAELDDYLAGLYPPSSRHGFSVSQLIEEEVAFFIARCEDAEAGCGAIKFYGQEYGEVKRVFVRPAFRGRGLAKLIMLRLEDCAVERGVGLIRLETGTYQPEALGLYDKLGYQRIGAFGPYTEDPLCVYYEKNSRTKEPEGMDTDEHPGLYARAG